jgi:hypothetical protein
VTYRQHTGTMLHDLTRDHGEHGGLAQGEARL